MDDEVVREQKDIRVLVSRIKDERKIVREFIDEYNAMRDYNPRDSRLKGFSHAINCHKSLIEGLQQEIDEYNAKKGHIRKERTYETK